MSNPNLKELCGFHTDHYRKHEMKENERALRLYGNRILTGKNGSVEDREEALKEQYWFNLTHAHVSSAVSELVGSNPRVYSKARTSGGVAYEANANIIMENIYTDSEMRTVIARRILDAALRRRGVFKVKTSPATRMPRIFGADPARTFYDLTAEKMSDSAYMLECTQVPWSQFAEKVASGEYANGRLGKISQNGYDLPSWVKDAMFEGDRPPKAMRWVNVWEFYDAWNGTVRFYHLETDSVLYEEAVDDHPYAMFSLIPNGTNMTGLSEAEMIRTQQYWVDKGMTHWGDTIEHSVGGLLADGSIVDAASVEAAATADPGAIKVVNRAGGSSNRRRNQRFEDAFMQKPVPQHPEQNEKFLGLVVDHAQQISGFAPGQRGAAVNVRTAQEMAFIQAGLRGLATAKENELSDAIALISSKAWDRVVRFAPNDLEVRSEVTGEFVSTGDWLSEAGKMKFRMVPYNPVRHDPAVQAETILANQQWFIDNPNYDKRRLDEVVITGLGLPDHVLRPKAEVEAEAQAAAEAAAAAPPPDMGGLPPGMGGLPMGGPPPEAGLPQELALPPVDAGVPENLVSPEAMPGIEVPLG